MPKGSVRAYGEELDQFGFRDHDHAERNQRAEFRGNFSTQLFASNSTDSVVVSELSWGDDVELPDGLSNGNLTQVVVGAESGFVRSNHLVQIAYVKRRGTTDNKLKGVLRFESDGRTQKRELIWGDMVQIIKRGATTSHVRGRAYFGEMNNSELSDEPLLEVYFIDVGQGDGVLVRTPDGRHLLVDGGLERAKQITGKNAADFVDWKFFFDYGDYKVRLESMSASHSDNDHYGGLHDLVRITPAADRELDCLETEIATLHHPGLSRWEKRTEVDPPHHDGLGPKRNGHFVRLLGDRADAEAAIVNGADDELSGPWMRLFRDVINNSVATQIERVGVAREQLQQGGPLPELWPSAAGCSIRVLGPVTVQQGGQAALPDLGVKSINTNGHSICYRIDFKHARILLTGDLNKMSMDWLRGCYGDRIGAFECDVAKACHHGSHDISFRFLEEMRAAATVISSGDAEGHAHPRPEIVGASAISGYHSVDRESDKLLTPLIYLTEVERSVSLGAVNRIDFQGLPIGDESVAGILPGRHLDELSTAKRISPTEQAEIEKAPAAQQPALKKQLNKRLKELEVAATDGTIRASYYYSVPQGPLHAEHKEKRVWRSRIMEKNHYGLVNVRSDGQLIMCATLDETEEDWIIHTFPARFDAE